MQRGLKSTAVMMKVEIGAAVLLIGVIVLLVARHSRRTTDSIGRYALAVGALRRIADEPLPVVTPEAHPSDTRHLVQMLPDVAPASEASARPRRATGRRAGRPDPELVARRPVIAHLPSISAPRTDEADRHAG
jgi:hypothetical protein